MALLERGVALAALQNKSQPTPETYTSLSREMATSEAVSVKASSKKIKWMIAIAALFMISLLKGPQPQVPAQTSKAAAPATEVVSKFDCPTCSLKFNIYALKMLRGGKVGFMAAKRISRYLARIDRVRQFCSRRNVDRMKILEVY